jgi:glyoxylase-like metal-dependent hydrolase (beta-lactamase superfamily II)
MTDQGDPKMQTVIPGLHVCPPQALSFAPSLHVRSFLLQREQGNLLVYGTATAAEEARAIADLGGATRHYLSHWHEADIAGEGAFSALDIPVFCHEDGRAEVARTAAVAGTFAARHMAHDDFEVIPIPGHTPGTTAYLWDSGAHRCLFTGDTLYLRRGEWVAAVLESSDRATYIDSLELIKELQFDVLVPWAATVGEPFHATTDKADAGRRIDAILERLRRGDDH